jgi:hypothetical protein
MLARFDTGRLPKGHAIFVPTCIFLELIDFDEEKFSPLPELGQTRPGSPGCQRGARCKSLEINVLRRALAGAT